MLSGSLNFVSVFFKGPFLFQATGSAVSMCMCVKTYVCETDETFAYNSIFTAVSINREKLIFCKRLGVAFGGCLRNDRLCKF